MKVLVPLAAGFEEIEAITIIDVLRRAQIDVVTAYLDKNPVLGSHDVPVIADAAIETVQRDEFDAIVLPGGMPGSTNLKNSQTVKDIIHQVNKKGGYLAAICAAPIVLGAAGVLEGKRATCFPGNEGELHGAILEPKPYVIDGSIITGNGAGAALSFALQLVKVFKSEKEMQTLRERMLVFWKE